MILCQLNLDAFTLPNTRNQISAELEEWKKKSASVRFVKKIKKQNPESDVEVWSMDEPRIGLKPVREKRMGG
jgi:hypothetical protein